MDAKQAKKRSVLELLMVSQLSGCNETADFYNEFKFNQSRKWRFDFAWPIEKVALEIEGGTWVSGAHTRGKGYEEDIEKYNTAVLAGWKIIRATGTHVKNGMALAWIRTALKRAEAWRYAEI